MNNIHALLDSIGERALAKTIAELLNEHEDLLQAEQNGPTVIVRERGGDRIFRLTVRIAGEIERRSGAE